MKKALSVMVISILMLSIWCITTYTYANVNEGNITPSVSYSSHLENIGWEEEFSNIDGQTSGRIDQALKMEALKIRLENAPSNASISYQVHVQDIGWMNDVSNGKSAGTTGRNLKIEAIRVKINGLENYDVMYRAYVDGMGWQDWVKNGELAGTSGQNRRLFAFQIKILPKSFSVKYHSYVAGSGWEKEYSKQDGESAGTTGKNLKLEALKIKLDGAPQGASIIYQSHVQDIGWQNWVKEGQVTGVAGKALKVEAIRLKLTGITGYSIQYRAHVQDIGWQDWVSDGVQAGTTGKNLKVEAIQIRIVRNDSPNVVYSSHVQDIGWEDDFSKADGTISGTTGKNLKVEAMKIKLVNAPENAKILYQSYVQKNGWQSWKEDGALTGTTGKNLKLEAIRIKLEGMENYTIRYRAHVQDIGWQKWVSEGETAGTIGKGLKVEAIQIELVPLLPPDKTNPVITLKGNELETVKLGDVYKNPGATALDNKDGNITSKITVNSTVNTSKIGTYTVTYRVEDIAGNYTIKVRTVKVVDYVTGIEITSKPAKTEYKQGESLNLDGLVVKATMKSGTKQNVDISKCIITGYNKTKLGEQIVTITYEGKMATFKVKVTEDDYVKGIEITSNPTKIEYKQGESLELDGLVVKATMKSGTKINVDISKCIITGYDSSKLGEQTITITYEGKTATFKVKVTENDYITGIEITSNPIKTEYQYGEELNLDGLVIKAVMKSGIRKDVDIDECLITGYDKNTTGEQTITITYEEKTATFKVNVNDYIVGIEIVSNPTKTEYQYGEELNLDGLVIEAVMKSGIRENVDINECSVTGYEETIVAKQTITVTYEEKTVTFEVVVEKEFASLLVSKEQDSGYAHEQFIYGTISEGIDENPFEITQLKYQVKDELGNDITDSVIDDKKIVEVIFEENNIDRPGEILIKVTAEKIGNYTIIPYVGVAIDDDYVIVADEQNIEISHNPIIDSAELVDFSETEQVRVKKNIIKDIVFKNMHGDILENVHKSQVKLIAEGVEIEILEESNPGTRVTGIQIKGKTEGTHTIQILVNRDIEGKEKVITLGNIIILPEAKKLLNVNGQNSITILQQEPSETIDNIVLVDEVPYTLIPIKLVDEDGEETTLKGNELVLGQATTLKPLSVTYDGYDPSELFPLIDAKMFNNNKEVITSAVTAKYLGIALAMGTEKEDINGKDLILKYVESEVKLTIEVKDIEIQNLIIIPENLDNITNIPTIENHIKTTIGSISSGLREKELEIEYLNYRVEDELGNDITNSTENGEKIVKVTFEEEVTRPGEILVNVQTQKEGNYTIIPYVTVGTNVVEVEQKIESINNPMIAVAEIEGIATAEIKVEDVFESNLILKNSYGDILKEVEASKIEVTSQDFTITLLNNGSPIANTSDYVTGIQLVAKSEGENVISVLVNKGTENEKTIEINVTVLEKDQIELDINDMTEIHLYETKPNETTYTIYEEEVVVGEEVNKIIYTLVPVSLKNTNIVLKGNDIIIGNEQEGKISLTVTDSENYLIDAKMFKDETTLAEEADNAQYIGIALGAGIEEIDVEGKTITLTYGESSKTLIIE